MKHKISTQQLAKDTADELLEQGIRPTQQNVRERMGTGSLTTINKALNSWWVELGQRLKAQSAMPAIPDPVAQSMEKLWKQSVQYAKQEFSEAADDLERQYQQKIKALKRSDQDDQNELKQLREQCLRLLQGSEKLSEEKRELLRELSVAENSLMAASAERDDLRRQIKQSDLLGGAGVKSVDEYIELRVENKTLFDECDRLRNQLAFEISSKAELQKELAIAQQEIASLKAARS